MEVSGKPVLVSCVHSSDDDSDLDSENYVILDDDDSDEDPTFDPVELTRSHLSKLSLKKKSNNPRIPEDKFVLDPRLHVSTVSIKKKSKPRIAEGMEDKSDEEMSDSVEFISTELNETDQKSFEAVEKMIHSGVIDKLKLDQCKVYLRKHGLRLTGNKEILLNRIKEHLEIIDGGGKRKYPVYSFILNCKGDACTGDVVMFEQNVYEIIVSRSATGPSCGTRTVAGRIVKESYGAEKQQHTFTIEVLWSEGEKPLPPLHPLLIKGRNLYRLKTMRQRWEDEGERQKILSDKHARGSLARSNRDARLVEKEKRKTLRASKKVNSKRTCQPSRNISDPLTDVHMTELLTSNSHNNEKQSVPLKNHPVVVSRRRRPLDNVKEIHHSNGVGGIIGNQYQNHHPLQMPIHHSNGVGGIIGNQYQNHHPLQMPIHHSNGIGGIIGNQNYHHHPLQMPFKERYRGPPPPLFRGGDNRENERDSRGLSSPYRGGGGISLDLREALRCNIFQRFDYDNRRQQPCRFFAQGRCTFGERCKYLHEVDKGEFQRWSNDNRH
ncbi:zinc finger CCCH domain-containing protein 62 isoform X2 [Impatiens glandulifera]|uniref:zinc finger CCCH domain-containing protein 62 isoform X2 n=1 Tax=Impatiens glandulifera TaxID=253017 RepID=UPI001FB173BE|nr:zinc finger CCCH domain-containing protein 62 isoform X2 [Impatiens glandulifera]